MRVLHVDTAAEWRGGQTQLLHLLRARPQDIVAMRPDADWRSAVEALGNPVRFVPFRGAWRGTRGLLRIVREAAPDLVAAHTSHAHGHAWLAGGAPFVVHRRSDFVPGRWSGAKYRAPVGYVAVSAAVREVLVRHGVPRERVAVVHDGVDPQAFEAPRAGPEHGDRDVPRVVAVGALVAHKGHEVLIDAVGLLGRPVELVIAGEGERRAFLERRAADRGVSVRFLGSVADVPALLRTADAFAQPSREEGLGQAVIEAMLAGVPVVASAAGGLPEIVAPGTGTLVPAGDPVALVEALDRILRDRVEALGRADAARIHARAFGVEAMVRGTEAAWSEALSRAGG